MLTDTCLDHIVVFVGQCVVIAKGNKMHKGQITDINLDDTFTLTKQNGTEIYNCYARQVICAY